MSPMARYLRLVFFARPFLIALFLTAGARAALIFFPAGRRRGALFLTEALALSGTLFLTEPFAGTFFAVDFLAAGARAGFREGAARPLAGALRAAVALAGRAVFLTAGFATLFAGVRLAATSVTAFAALGGGLAAFAAGLGAGLALVRASVFVAP